MRRRGTGELSVPLCFCYSFTTICRPLHSNGTKYHPEELPQAFTELLLSFPQCPCATQDPNPGDDHNVNIWVVQTGRYAGKIAAACPRKAEGCNMWSKLLCLIFLYAVNISLFMLLFSLSE